MRISRRVPIVEEDGGIATQEIRLAIQSGCREIVKGFAQRQGVVIGTLANVYLEITRPPGEAQTAIAEARNYVVGRVLDKVAGFLFESGIRADTEEGFLGKVPVTQVEIEK